MSILHLPDDILLELCSYLEWHDIPSLSEVCVSFSTFVRRCRADLQTHVRSGWRWHYCEPHLAEFIRDDGQTAWMPSYQHVHDPTTFVARIALKRSIHYWRISRLPPARVNNTHAVAEPPPMLVGV